ncbi:LLM class flavin-dependent oxidoreductase [Wukongibacter sp. M2B1]|uniref:LLM class flavin-dependent oxidoreductase n=1 Tax=Wukongibacter sp. M2B1 TaxID=3088895 RepID=UPI003D7BE2DB
MSNEIRNEVKAYVATEGIEMKKLVEMINEKYGKNDSLSNLSNKLTRGTIKYREVKEIADVLGYEIEWKKKQD